MNFTAPQLRNCTVIFNSLINDKTTFFVEIWRERQSCNFLKHSYLLLAFINRFSVTAIRLNIVVIITINFNFQVKTVMDVNLANQFVSSGLDATQIKLGKFLLILPLIDILYLYFIK